MTTLPDDYPDYLKHSDADTPVPTPATYVVSSVPIASFDTDRPTAPRAALLSSRSRWPRSTDA